MKYLILSGLSLVLSCLLPAQNNYYPLTASNQNEGWIRTSAASAVSEGTPLFLYQHGGAQINLTGDNTGQISNLRGAGRFAFNRVLRTGGDTIHLALPLQTDFASSFTQVVTAPKHTSFTVTTDQQISQAFDGQTGGVLFLAATDSLTVAAALSARGAGFRGGQGQEADSDCNRLTAAREETYALTNWRGSPRGEGVAGVPSGQESGRAPAGNGGGGGNDHNAGGGGGANLGAGGGGARNIVRGLFNNACRGNFPGRAGRAIVPADDRLFFGGGGGAGHANNTTMASGGNGGGFIVLWAPYLQFADGATVDAGGADAGAVDGDGGGGGGAAGSIFLLADELAGRPNVILNGGRGADVNNPDRSRCFGPGGGGGGGRLLTSTRNRSTFAPFLEVEAGGNGLRLNSNECDEGEEPAGTGSRGARHDLDLVLPFGGFAVAGGDICGGQTLLVTDQSSGAQSVSWRVDHPNSEVDIRPVGNDLEIMLPDSAFGVYTIIQSLFFNGTAYPGDTATITVYPSAVVGTVTVVANEEEVNVSIDTARGFDAIRYDFGDGTVIDTNVFALSHTYQSGGNFPVTVTLLNARCGDLEARNQSVEVPEFASAKIDLKDAGGCAPYELNLADRSTGTYTEARWDFPGAFPSSITGSSPTVVYPDTGNYIVTLTLVNAVGPDTVSTIPVVVRFTPTADFSFSVDTATANFTSLSPGVDAYFWDFGDDSTSLVADPSHTYLAPGTYTVTQVVANGNCTDTLRREVVIEVLSGIRELAELGVKLFPNPTSGLLQLSGPANIVAVFDPLGRRVMQVSAKEVDLGQLPGGTYLVRILAEGQVHQLRVVKR